MPSEPKVEQRHRDAAASIHWEYKRGSLNWMHAKPEAERIRGGEWDTHSTVQAFAKFEGTLRATPPAHDALAAEQCVMVCPQCEGEGGYADGLDQAACHTDCTRCGTNGWIVDLAALASPAASAKGVERDAVIEECARKATSFLMGDPTNGTPLHSPSPHQIADAIRTLKGQP